MTTLTTAQCTLATKSNSTRSTLLTVDKVECVESDFVARVHVLGINMPGNEVPFPFHPERLAQDPDFLGISDCCRGRICDGKVNDSDFDAVSRAQTS